MKTKPYIHAVILLLAVLSFLLPARLAAQSTGRIEFEARVAATGGQPEPVRQLPFYLLRKSLQDIRAEATQAAPAPDLDKFVDGLEVSPELKAWMKKHHSVQLSGEEFTKSLTPEDIVGISEYFKAYMTHNAAYRGMGFPEPKFKEKDRKANPEKFQEQKDQYEASVRKFIAASPDSVKGMDLELVDLNPIAKWVALENKHAKMVEANVMQIAEERYVVARAETDLDGRGSFSGVAPGNYWIGMFGAEAISGDVRQHWDLRVTLRQGETASIELSNFNAIRSNTSAQNSSN
ncbi:MAG TPA: hypothetical protein VG272_04335 [Candidatus Acidoferrales bacterium]|jgi:hypothetical protein|nr:hypothetical protein [Candidatus Acidoferrales bacterium]